MDEVEEWRPVASWPYEVSSLGRVRRSQNGRFSTSAGRILKQTRKDEYPMVTLYNGSRATRCVVRVHILVCAAFHGERPSPAHEVAHWDGDEFNCRASNIRWATRDENSQDKIRHGRSRRGEQHEDAYFTNAEARALRDWAGDLRAQHGGRLPRHTVKRKAAALGISRDGLRNIINGVTYRGC